MPDKDLTELVFVLDRSGSMGARIDDVISGFNELVVKQRAEPGRAHLTVAVFDDKHDVLADAVNVWSFGGLSKDAYYARGMTSLFDAIALTVDRVGRRLAVTPEAQRPGKVLVTVMTDGLENNSKEYARHLGGAARLKAKMDHQRDKYAWDFVFVGANMDAVLAGGEVGFNPLKAMTFSNTEQGVGNTMRSLSHYASSYRSHATPQEASLNSTFSAEDRANALAGAPPAVAGTIVVTRAGKHE